MSEVSDIMSVAGLAVLLIVALRLDRKMSPQGLAKLATGAYNSFRMSVTGKEGVHSKRRTKLQSLMQNFAIEEIGPEIAEIAGVPPIVGSYILKKVNDSELGDFLRENPEMMPDALQLAGTLFSKLQEGMMSGNIATPQRDPTGTQTEGW